MRIGILHGFLCLSQLFRSTTRQKNLYSQSGNGQNDTKQQLYRYGCNAQQLGHNDTRQHTGQAGGNHIRRGIKQHAGHTKQHEADEQHKDKTALEHLTGKCARHIADQCANRAARQENA